MRLFNDALDCDNMSVKSGSNSSIIVRSERALSATASRVLFKTDCRSGEEESCVIPLSGDLKAVLL